MCVFAFTKTCESIYLCIYLFKLFNIKTYVSSFINIFVHANCVCANGLFALGDDDDEPIMMMSKAYFMLGKPVAASIVIVSSKD